MAPECRNYEEVYTKNVFQNDFAVRYTHTYVMLRKYYNAYRNLVHITTWCLFFIIFFIFRNEIQKDDDSSDREYLLGLISSVIYKVFP